MIQETNCVSLSEFELWHHSQNWPQSLVKLGADFVPQAVKREKSLKPREHRQFLGPKSNCITLIVSSIY